MMLAQQLAQSSEPLFRWSEVILQYCEFIASFAMLGAVGFRFVVLRPMLVRAGGGALDDAVPREAARGAARIGLLGALLMLLTVFLNLLSTAAEKHRAFGTLVLHGGWQTPLQLALVLVSIVAFAAAMRAGGAWPLAALAVLLFMLRSIFTLKLRSLVNPLHRVGGGLWIGTLFVLLAAGLPAALRARGVSRDRAVADLVNAFSPLALFGSGLLAVSGVTTAWLHLHRLAALWTTPYGYTLIIKLCLVLIVVALGAWNWRRVRPTLGTERSTGALRRSAGSELAVAALVLVATAFLVSIPSPRAPKPPGATATPPTAAAP